MNLELLNLNKSSSQCCVYCGKNYKNKTSLNKHRILCELYYNSKNRKLKEDEIEVPSQRKLYLMLLEFADKFNNLEEKVNEINKLVIKDKKKINIIKWLNDNMRPQINFNQLFERIIINDTDDVDYLFENSFIDTLNNIFLSQTLINFTSFPTVLSEGLALLITFNGVTTWETYAGDHRRRSIS